MKTVSVTSFLTKKELYEAATLAQYTKNGKLATTICEKIIKPNIERINHKLGQENDPMFLAYMVEYALGQGGFT